MDYREYTYAAGKIPGGFIKREGRPSEKEILTSRLIDRPVRPLFPEGFLNETQIIAMVLSADPEQDPELPGHHRRRRRAGHLRHSVPSRAWAACASACVNGEYVANPTYSEGRESKLNIIVAGTEDGIVMVEAGAQQASEEEVARSHRVRPRLLQEDRRRHPRTGRQGRQAEARLHAARPRTQTLLRQDFQPGRDRTDRRAEHPEVPQARELQPRSHELKKQAAREPVPKSRRTKPKKIFDALKERIFRDEMLKSHRRPDGRAFDEIRQITIEVGVLPRTHGSALFTRGETQALVTVTLGTKDDEQRIEMLDPGEASKRFMLHYNFPPFSVGEVGFMRGPGRREIGHGALAERALAADHSRRKSFPLHPARGQRHSGIERFQLDGYRLRRHPGADGCRRADLAHRWPASPWVW